MKKITVIIPAHNEEDRIERAASRILGEPYLCRKVEFLFIVDGNDRTYDILIKMGEKYPKAKMRIKKYPKRLGKGGAVAEGIRNSHTPYVGFLDVDISIPIEQINRMVELLLGEKLDCIVGIRREVKGIPATRKLSSLSFNLLVNSLFGLGLKDTQCGCKFFKKKFVTEHEELFRVKGFAFDVELLDLIRRKGGEITGHEIISSWEGGKFSLFESPKMLLDIVWLKLS